jgi:predicted HicB family RNase H-like nuclease
MKSPAYISKIFPQLTGFTLKKYIPEGIIIVEKGKEARTETRTRHSRREKKMSIIEVHMSGVNEMLCPRALSGLGVFGDEEANQICQAGERAFDAAMVAAGFRADWHARLEFRGSFRDWNGGRFHQQGTYEGGCGLRKRLAEAIDDYLDEENYDGDEPKPLSGQLHIAIEHAEDEARAAMKKESEKIEASYTEATE